MYLKSSVSASLFAWTNSTLLLLRLPFGTLIFLLLNLLYYMKNQNMARHKAAQCLVEED